MIKYIRFKLPVELQVKHKNEKRRMQNDEIQRKKMMRVGKKMMRVGKKMMRVGKRKGSDKRRCRHVSKRREWIRTI